MKKKTKKKKQTGGVKRPHKWRHPAINFDAPYYTYKVAERKGDHMQRSNSSLQAQRDVFSSDYLFKIALNFGFVLLKKNREEQEEEEEKKNEN